MFDGSMNMDEGITERPWPSQLDAQREAMVKHISDIARPGMPAIVDSANEKWFYSFVGWLLVGVLALGIVFVGWMLQ